MEVIHRHCAQCLKVGGKSAVMRPGLDIRRREIDLEDLRMRRIMYASRSEGGKNGKGTCFAGRSGNMEG